jgi:hypothetical protein
LAREPGALKPPYDAKALVLSGLAARVNKTCRPVQEPRSCNTNVVKVFILSELSSVSNANYTEEI